MASPIDDAELIKGAFIISRRVAELMVTLNNLQLSFVAGQDPKERRELTTRYLAILTEFIDEQSPHGMDTAMPMHQVIAALISASRGDTHPLTQPVQRQGGRPQRSINRRSFEVCVAAAIDILMAEPANLNRAAAAKFVSRKLNQLGMQIDGKALDYKQLLEWRKALKEAPNSPEADRYRFLSSKRGSFLEPKAAVHRMLKAAARDGLGLGVRAQEKKGD